MRQLWLSVLALVLAPCLLTPCVLAQAQPPAFEVATVKPGTPGTGDSGHWSLPAVGRFDAVSVTLQKLIELAYDVDATQIQGAPGWMRSELYDVSARPEAGVKLTREELRPRLQLLLQQRFHLQTHRETKSLPGYALVVAKSGPKLQVTKAEHFPGWRTQVNSGHVEGVNWSMPILASYLVSAAGAPVMDKTGIAGSYDIKLVFAPDAESPLPSLFTELKETLGLELKADKVPVEVVVIDRVDRVPEGN